MKKYIKSNIIFAIAAICLTGCMQEHATSNYTSDVTGYETSVVKEEVKNAVQTASAQTAPAKKDIPVIINNPYAVSNAMVAQAASPVPVVPSSVVAYSSIQPAAGNPYGSLTSNAIQPGVFMQSTGSYTSYPTYGYNNGNAQ